MRLTPEEKALRRRERLRLIAYLLKGGRLIREDMPAGGVAWTRASRSGSPFSDRSVSKLRSRGYAVVRMETYQVIEDEAGRLRFADWV